MKELMPFGKKGGEGYFNPLTGFQRRMNDLFEDFFKGGDEWPLACGLSGKTDFIPKIDVTESDKGIKVTAELPGLSEKDVEVLLDNNVLTIKGEKHEEHEQKENHHHYVERKYGSFYRSIPLPAEIEQDKIEASCNNGVLTISLPKKSLTGSQAKKIPIKNA